MNVIEKFKAHVGVATLCLRREANPFTLCRGLWISDSGNPLTELLLIFTQVQQIGHPLYYSNIFLVIFNFLIIMIHLVP